MASGRDAARTTRSARSTEWSCEGTRTTSWRQTSCPFRQHRPQDVDGDAPQPDCRRAADEARWKMLVSIGPSPLSPASPSPRCLVYSENTCLFHSCASPVEISPRPSISTTSPRHPRKPHAGSHVASGRPSQSASVRRCAPHCSRNARTIGTTCRTGDDSALRSPRQSMRASAIVPGHGASPSPARIARPRRSEQRRPAPTRRAQTAPRRIHLENTGRELEPRRDQVALDPRASHRRRPRVLGVRRARPARQRQPYVIATARRSHDQRMVLGRATQRAPHACEHAIRTRARQSPRHELGRACRWMRVDVERNPLHPSRRRRATEYFPARCRSNTHALKRRSRSIPSCSSRARCHGGTPRLQLEPAGAFRPHRALATRVRARRR